MADGAALVSQHLVDILTAITLILIGGWLFQARDGFFLSGGLFRGKFVGLLLLLGAVAAVSVFTPFIDQFWMVLVSQYEVSRIAGLVVLAGMLAVNKSAEWNYLDWRSLVVYVIAAALILQPGPIDTLI